ncbi:MAG: methyltransferase family protein [Candidatus Binataceae bacterium]
MDETDSHLAHDNSGALKIHPPILAGLLLLAGFLLHLLGAHHRRMVYPHQLIGTILIAAAVGLSFYSAAMFRVRKTTKNPYGEPSTFVAAAPYRFTRNPMYLGLAIILLGFAVFFGSPVMLLAPILFFIVIDRMVIPQEEETMERLFGQQYADYKKRVRRWL